MLYLKLIQDAIKLYILGNKMAILQRRTQRRYDKCTSYTDPKLVCMTNRYASMCVMWNGLKAGLHETLSAIEETKL